MTNTTARPINRKALRGIAEVLEAAAAAKPPHLFIVTDEHGKREEIQSREQLLEHYLEYAIESIYQLTDTDE